MHKNIDDLSPKEIKDFLSRNWIGVCFAIIAAISGVIYQHFSNSQFSASSTILIQKPQSSPLQSISAKITGMNPYIFNSNDIQMEKYLHTLRSRYLYRKVAKQIKSLDKKEYKDLINHITEKKYFFWKKLFKLNETNKHNNQNNQNNIYFEDQLVNILQNITTVSNEGPENIIVTVKSNDPSTSVNIVNFIVDNAINLMLSRDMKEIEEAKKFIKLQLINVEERIKNIQQDLLKINEKNNYIVNGNLKLEINDLISENKKELLDLKVKSLQNEKLLKKLAEKLQKYRDPTIKYRMERIKTEQEFWETKQISLQEIQKNLLKSKTKYPSVQQVVDDLIRKREFEYTYLSELKKELLTIEVQRISLLNKTRAVEKASLATTYYHQLSIFKIIMASIIAGIFSFILLYVYEVFVPTIRSKQDLDFLNLTFLGNLPDFSKIKFSNFIKNIFLNNKRSLKKHIIWHKVKTGLTLNFPEKVVFNFIIQKLLPTLKRKKIQVISILSANSNEGKSMVACNLAYSLSLLGHKTLLIDTDIITNKIQKIFQFQAKKEHAVKVTDNFDILPASSYSTYAVDLFFSNKFQKMLNETKKEYEFVIIDTPPLLFTAESLAIAGTSDLPVIVVEQNKTKIADIEKIVNELRFSGAKDLTYILNKYGEIKNSIYFNLHDQKLKAS